MTPSKYLPTQTIANPFLSVNTRATRNAYILQALIEIWQHKPTTYNWKRCVFILHFPYNGAVGLKTEKCNTLNLRKNALVAPKEPLVWIEVFSNLTHLVSYRNTSYKELKRLNSFALSKMKEHRSCRESGEYIGDCNWEITSFYGVTS